LKFDDRFGVCKMDIISLDGKTVFKATGNINSIEEKLNTKISSIQAGSYILMLEEKNGQNYRTKFIKL
jgi:hypothetical protein